MATHTRGFVRYCMNYVRKRLRVSGQVANFHISHFCQRREVENILITFIAMCCSFSWIRNENGPQNCCSRKCHPAVLSPVTWLPLEEKKKFPPNHFSALRETPNKSASSKWRWKMEKGRRKQEGEVKGTGGPLPLLISPPPPPRKTHTQKEQMSISPWIMASVNNRRCEVRWGGGGHTHT